MEDKLFRTSRSKSMIKYAKDYMIRILNKQSSAITTWNSNLKNSYLLYPHENEENSNLELNEGAQCLKISPYRKINFFEVEEVTKDSQSNMECSWCSKTGHVYQAKPEIRHANVLLMAINGKIAKNKTIFQNGAYFAKYCLTTISTITKKTLLIMKTIYLSTLWWKLFQLIHHIRM